MSVTPPAKGLSVDHPSLPITLFVTADEKGLTASFLYGEASMVTVTGQPLATGALRCFAVAQGRLFHISGPGAG